MYIIIMFIVSTVIFLLSKKLKTVWEKIIRIFNVVKIGTSNTHEQFMKIYPKSYEEFCITFSMFFHLE